MLIGAILTYLSAFSTKMKHPMIKMQLDKNVYNISAGVDGGPSGVRGVSRHGSEDPHWH